MKRLVPIVLLVGCLLCAQSAFAADQPAASGDSASTASSAVAAVRMQESASTQLSLGGV